MRKGKHEQGGGWIWFKARARRRGRRMSTWSPKEDISDLWRSGCNTRAGVELSGKLSNWLGKEKVEEERVHELKWEIGGERKKLLQGGKWQRAYNKHPLPMSSLILWLALCWFDSSHTSYAYILCIIKASRYLVMFQASRWKIIGIYDIENS